MKLAAWTFKQEPGRETRESRKARVEMAGAVRTRVVPDKTKYSRKRKHKGGYDD